MQSQVSLEEKRRGRLEKQGEGNKATEAETQVSFLSVLGFAH